MSPGTVKGTKTTWSSTRANDLPSAAQSVMVTFSRMGNAFLFRDILVILKGVFDDGCDEPK